MSDLWSARLSESLDGDLSAREARALALHLGECAACACELEGLRRVKAAIQGLPAGAPPERVWHSIRARIVAGRGARPRPWGWSFASASAAIVLLAVAVTWVMWPRERTDRALPAPEGGAAQNVAAGEAALRYGAAAAAWKEALLVQVDDAGMSEVLAGNLRPYDRAIEETRQAIDREPEDPLLREHLSRLLRAQLHFLRRAGATAGGFQPRMEADG